MKTKSAKAKARRLQDWVVERLKVEFDLYAHDIRPAIMGESGADVKLLTEDAKTKIPFAIECKAQEKYKAIYDIMAQAHAHVENDPMLQAGEKRLPLGVITMNRKKPLVIVDAEIFFGMAVGCTYE